MRSKLELNVLRSTKDILERKRFNPTLGRVEISKRQSEILDLVSNSELFICLLIVFSFSSGNVRDFDIKWTRLVAVDVEHSLVLNFDVVVKPRLTVKLTESIHRRQSRGLMRDSSFS